MAVKPQIFAETARAKAGLAKDAVIVSIAAGVSIATMSQLFGAEASIVRAMPNLPALVGKGISAAVANDYVSQKQRCLAGDLLAAAGDVVWVDKEDYLNPVTAVSGSGPAYVFLLIECLTRAGIDVGLPPDLAERLARATIVGSGALVDETSETAASLREGVTSPAGTTAAALSILMGERGLDDLVRRAVAAANARAKELGR
jgi:pyrroline-5-carboxylate reductase